MLLPGTQMHIVTFVFVCIEIVIFFYLVIYKLARPDDRNTSLNIVLITLLITYNVTGGLLPDPNLPGSTFLQESIAYGTGFVTPCYFPYYVCKVFGLVKMGFHVKKGVFLFLFLPYLLFIFMYSLSGSLTVAKNVLGLPVLYALWVIYSLVLAIKDKYQINSDQKRRSKEANFLFLSIAPWIGLPVIAFFNLSQAAEAFISNGGFLLLLGLQVNRHIREQRIEHHRLQETEHRLLNWSSHLQEEVNKRTKELEKIIEQRTNTFINLAHETKTPLTLIYNYLEDYINKNGVSEELAVVKNCLSKLSNDIVNLFDVELHNRGIKVYNHDQVCDFSQIINKEILLFQQYAWKKKIRICSEIQPGIYIKADPVALTSLINNLVENAIKFSFRSGEIFTELKSEKNRIVFTVRDEGFGIPSNLHEKVFQPYFQITNHKSDNQGMGLGLPIVKKIIDDLDGIIEIESKPLNSKGTQMKILLKEYTNTIDQVITGRAIEKTFYNQMDYPVISEQKEYDERLATILLLEDNVAMADYLGKKLGALYNVYTVPNGNEGIGKLKKMTSLPDIIISDVVMGKLDGFHFARIVSRDPLWNHIPFIFLSAKNRGQDRMEGLRAGAVDFIQKPFLIEELLRKTESILRILNRQKAILLNAEIKALVHRDLNFAREDTFYEKCKGYHLSPREKDIVKLIFQGIKYEDIGEVLFISVRTVTTHAQNIFAKVGVKNKIELINRLQTREGG